MTQSSMATSFSQWGGSRVGFNSWLAMSSTWPFVRVEVAPDRFEFSEIPFFFLRPLVLTPATAHRLSIYTGLRPGSFMRPPRYLRVEHRVPGYPAFLLFYSFNLPRLVTELAQCGFVVEGT